MIRQLSPADAIEVVTHMRPQDRACMRALLGEQADEGDEVFAIERYKSSGPAWTLLSDDGTPIGSGLRARAWCAAEPGVCASKRFHSSASSDWTRASSSGTDDAGTLR